MNTCILIASAVWLHISDGYNMQYINTSNIVRITQSGGIVLNSTATGRGVYAVWDDSLDRYLTSDEIFVLIQSCDSE